MESELARCGRSVDPLGDALKADAIGAEVFHDTDQVGQGARQAIEPPHNERVSRAQRLATGVELRPVECLPRLVLLVDATAAGALKGSSWNPFQILR